MRIWNRLPALLAAIALGASSGFAVACVHDEGPAEEIGESLDELGDEVEDGLD